MKLIKLSAIDSTNDFLKGLAQNGPLENFTTVIAESQTKGRGQMGTSWVSEEGKNLIMSVLIKDVVNEASQVFHLNVAVSLSVIEVLEALKIPKLSIKWPNDILSDDKKIAGILIENRFRSDSHIESVAGIGLNVNQQDFAGLPNASSLALITGTNFDVGAVLEQLMVRIQMNCSSVLNQNSDALWQKYHSYLFMKDIEMRFEGQNGNAFTGKIIGVSKEGLLEVMFSDKSIRTFGLKEIKMCY